MVVKEGDAFVPAIQGVPFLFIKRLLFLVNPSLLPFYILVHEFSLFNGDIVWEHFEILLIVLYESQYLIMGLSF